MSDANKAEIQHRVAALVGGSKDPRNLDRIFSWIRFRTHGHRLTRDIGDFACHFTDRDQGRTFDGAQLIVDALQTFPWNFWRLGHMAPPNATADEVAKVAIAGLTIKDPSWFRPALGVSKNAALKDLKHALLKVDGIVSGNLRLKSQLSNRERRVLESFLRDMPDRLFTGSQLASEFAKVLSVNKLLSAPDAEISSKIEGILSVYAIEKMHQRRLVSKNWYPVDLIAGQFGPHLAIYGDFVTPWGEVEASARLPIFTTTCKPEEWLEGWQPEIMQAGSTLVRPLELNRDGKLSVIN